MGVSAHAVSFFLLARSSYKNIPETPSKSSQHILLHWSAISSTSSIEPPVSSPLKDTLKHLAFAYHILGLSTSSEAHSTYLIFTEPIHTTRALLPKPTKMPQVWYCPSCRFGPLNPAIDAACPNCGWYPGRAASMHDHSHLDGDYVPQTSQSEYSAHYLLALQPVAPQATTGGTRQQQLYTDQLPLALLESTSLDCDDTCLHAE